MGKTVRIGDSPDSYIIQIREARDEPCDRLPFVFADHRICFAEGRAAVEIAACCMPAADVSQILDSGQHARDAFVVLCAGHPSAGQRIRCRTELVGRQFLQQVSPSPHHAEVRPEKLVGRTRQEITLESSHVDKRVWCKVYGVQEAERAGFASPAADVRHRVDRADRIRRAADRDQTRSIGDLRTKVIQIQRAVFPVEFRVADRRSRVTRRQHPGSYVRIVIQSRDNHFVAGLPGPGQCPR